MGCAVVLDNDRMVHRDVRSPLLEVVLHRVAAVVHHLLDEHVGLVDCGRWIVHEQTLGCLPLLHVPFAARGLQAADLKLPAALSPFEQLALRKLWSLDLDATHASPGRIGGGPRGYVQTRTDE